MAISVYKYANQQDALDAISEINDVIELSSPATWDVPIQPQKTEYDHWYFRDPVEDWLDYSEAILTALSAAGLTPEEILELPAEWNYTEQELRDLGYKFMGDE